MSLIFRFIPRQTYFLGTFIFISLITYLAFHQIYKKNSYDFIKNWKSAEDTSIAEGNILGSMVKIQRSLVFTKEIESVSLFKIKNESISKIIHYGKNKRIDLSHIQYLNNSNDIILKNNGFFGIIGYLKIDPDKNFFVAFSFNSFFIKKLFFITITILGLIFFLFQRMQKNLIHVEHEKRLNLIQKSLKNILQNTEPDQILKKEVPFLDHFWSDLQTMYLNIKKQQQDYVIKDQLAELATQVAHDIRSPLAALNMSIKHLPPIPEEDKEIINLSIQRIHDIANSLLKNKRPLDAVHSIHNENLNPKNISLTSIIQELMTEKRMQYKNNDHVSIDFSSLDHDNIFISHIISPKDLKIILSNLINNSVESFDYQKKGHISIRCDSYNNQFAQITIQDNGSGISPEILHKLGEKGMTHGKKDGHGLGLYHAKKTIESYGGHFHIQSQVNQGTVISFSIPIINHTSLYISQLNINHHTALCIVDDDPLIHGLWIKKNIHPDVKIYHFDQLNTFKSSLAQLQEKHANLLHLIDFHFSNSSQSGLDFIKDEHLSHNAILVTSQYDDVHIINQCQKINLKILPKSSITSLNIQMNKNVLG
jgi:signal transduction histidine kinase